MIRAILIAIIEMKSKKMSIRSLNENIQNKIMYQIYIKIFKMYQKYTKNIKNIKLSLHSLHM